MSSRQASAGIIVGVDGSPPSMAAVEWAARDAEMRDVPLKLVCISPPVPELTVPSGDYSSAQQDFEHHVLEEASKIAVEATSARLASQMSSEVLYAPIFRTLIDLSKHAGMMVVGCRGQGAVARALLGSVSAGLVRHAQCPVAVIHHKDTLAAVSSQAPVVVGIDGSPTSELATEIAFDEASRRGVELVALHAWSDTGPLGFRRPGQAPVEWTTSEAREQEILAERLSGSQELYPDVEVRRVVARERPAVRLLQEADSAQLVVVGSRGRGGFTGMLLGSVSRAIVNCARVPVIVARMPQQHREASGFNN